MGCVGLACLALSFTTVTGGQWDEIYKLTADDPEDSDQFGYSVAVSDGIVVVGAWHDDDGGPDSGSAYAFDATTGQQLFKLTAGDAAEGDCFGVSVSAGPNTIVVGAPYDDDAGNNSGSVYVFDAATGIQLYKLTANDADYGDYFGGHVSISGSTIVVGAHQDDDAADGSGSAYVFDAATGQQIHKLTADDAGEDDRFGESVSIAGNIIVVGAHHDDLGAFEDAGSAFVFNATTGQQLLWLTADDAADSDWFGYSVSISGNTVVIGARGDDDKGNESGAAYLFDAETGEQLHKITAYDGAAQDYFGEYVGISGTDVIIGASGDDDNGGVSGSAYVFDAASGEQIQKLTAGDGAATDEFGLSVSVNCSIAVIGARMDDDTATDSGSTYVFNRPTPCPADLNDDGIVDISDLFGVLTFWGQSGVPADINQDGIVDIDDLFEVLDNWGPCP